MNAPYPDFCRGTVGDTDAGESFRIEGLMAGLQIPELPSLLRLVVDPSAGVGKRVVMRDMLPRWQQG